MIRDPQIANGTKGPAVNLTGPITSVGAATSIASQTGTGTTFAMSETPTFIGPVNTTGAFISSSSIFTNGYTSGAGGSVTQTGTHSTAVTLNRPTGRILGFSQAKNANVPITYILNNNTIGPQDTVILTQFSGNSASFDTFSVWLSCQVNSGGGMARIQILPRDSATFAVNINFSVIRGSTS